MASEKWTKDELRASVYAYMGMLEMERAGQKFVKAVLVRELIARELKSRSKSAVENRFQNISSVLSDSGKPWVKGYKPLSHVGSFVHKEIHGLINEYENSKS